MKKILVMCLSGLLLLNVSGCFNKTEPIQTTSSVAAEDSEENNEDNTADDEVNNYSDDSADKEVKPVENEKTALASDKNKEAQNKDSENKSDNVEQAKPVNKKTVVIDPGHGNHSNLEKEQQSPDSDIMKIKDGGGAQGIATGAPEYEVNMKVAMKLKSLLEQNNFNVIMTKTEHSESPGNIERAEVGNKNNAALEIRIHCDSSDNQSADGASMLVPENLGYAGPICNISRHYGQVILNSLVNTCGMKNRGIMPRNDMTGFNWSKVPVVLVEMGFMSNPSEDKMLSDDNYQNKLAQGLCNGIVEALK
ncbi:MAG: N-acetylmuramoyl-L-alanine amidase [Clostridium sp.]|nr:N-acetylmuramoyl-L-alanine amidase [Clostridium sp.]